LYFPDAMIDKAYLETVAAALRRHHQFERFDQGMADSEIDCVEQHFGFTFPPDLRTVLQFALPIGTGFPDWRNGSETDLLSRMNGPLDGIWFDVEHNGFWLPEWGTVPSDPQSRLEIVRQAVWDAPRLVPVYSHRYIPTTPHLDGNPVFSVHQTDIIYYGNDLADYFHREFRVPLPAWASPEPRPIRFWDAALAWRD
jgi:hypothetical protein